MNRYIKTTPSLSVTYNGKGGIRLLTPDEVVEAGTAAHRDRAIPGEEMWNRVAVLTDPATGAFRIVARPDAEDHGHEMSADEDLPILPFGIGSVRLMAPR